MVLLVDPDVNSLLDLHYHPHRHAGSGQPGQGGNRNGSSGQDLVVPVPPGTVVQTPDGEVLADLIESGGVLRPGRRRSRRARQRRPRHPSAQGPRFRPAR